MLSSYTDIKSFLAPSYQKCIYCNQILLKSCEICSDLYFYCEACQVYTNWNSHTILQQSRLLLTQVEKLLIIFLDKKTSADACSILKYSFVNDKLNINTTRRYFSLFCQITLDYYEDQMASILLDKEVEIDETHLYREKKSSAPHRPYKLSSIWLFGMKQRQSSKFFIIPLKNREESTLIPYIRKHVKMGSTVYSDSFSVYVNNHRKTSKLAQYKYVHYFINHKLEFLSQVSEEIHTNSIEGIWHEVKQDLKKRRTTSKYMFAIARFYFHKTLSKEQQIRLLSMNLTKLL